MRYSQEDHPLVGGPDDAPLWRIRDVSPQWGAALGAVGHPNSAHAQEASQTLAAARPKIVAIADLTLELGHTSGRCCRRAFPGDTRIHGALAASSRSILQLLVTIRGQEATM
jgi:hypothetical protein